MQTSVELRESQNWAIANQAHVIAAIDRIRLYLQQSIRQAQSDPPPSDLDRTLEFPHWSLEHPSTVASLCDRLGLSTFERDILLLCAGMELDGTWGQLCASAQGDTQRTYPTFSLALAALPESHWSALTPMGSLRRWRLIELGPGNTLTQSPLRLDERVLHYLLGIHQLDERLQSLITPIPITKDNSTVLGDSNYQLAQHIARVLVNPEGEHRAVVQLCGPDRSSKRAIARAVCQATGWTLHVMAGVAIPTVPGELNDLMRLWEREAFLNNSALLLDSDDVPQDNRAQNQAIARIIETYQHPLLLTSYHRHPPRQRSLITFDVDPPSPKEQRRLWQTYLNYPAKDHSSEDLNDALERLVSQFRLNAGAIQTACLKTQSRLPHNSEQNHEHLGQLLWTTCRLQGRSQMDSLAQRIESASTWEDLILPDKQRSTLTEIIAQVRQRARVYETWGFSRQSGRGLGITALFAGASGTGKTMAADIIANELQLDLYRIDLSSVVSKYIGETEKNLRRLFDAAEAGGAILLFDEADALFGKRTQVKDSHDRHANIEVAYLLQRMEAYHGLAILTTNLKESLDQAFLRRIRFVVQFPFPDAHQREAIWRGIFPEATPTEGLNYPKLGKLNVTGGNIRNIALNSAFIAADANEPIMMKHILEAARSEYMKLERPLTDVEIKGWI